MATTAGDAKSARIGKSAVLGLIGFKFHCFIKEISNIETKISKVAGVFGYCDAIQSAWGAGRFSPCDKNNTLFVRLRKTGIKAQYIV
jgi:hypothetical protein